MHPRHQAFLIIGTVEDADAAALRQRNHAAPHEVVVEFVGGRLLEGSDLAALRIDAFEDALDGAVLARRIHALKDHEQRPAVLRVKPLLEIVQPLAVGFEDLFGLVLVETALVVGLVRPEMERRPIRRNGTARQRASIDRREMRRALAHEVASSACVIATLTVHRAYGRTPSHRSIIRALPMLAAGMTSRIENSRSINAVTKRGIAAVRSPVPRTRWIAESSGWCCRARLASIRARSASPRHVDAQYPDHRDRGARDHAVPVRARACSPPPRDRFPPATSRATLPAISTAPSLTSSRSGVPDGK